jgi:hypothetical protein
VATGVTALRTEEPVTRRCCLKLIERERLLLLGKSVRPE